MPVRRSTSSTTIGRRAIRWRCSWDSAGYNTRAFASAHAFLAAAGSAVDGCALFDVRLPDMNGIELLSRLRTIGSRLPVVVITAYADIRLAVEAMKAGASDFIEKPYTADAILASIDRALSNAARSAADAGAVAAALERFARLTDREREVFDLLVGGLQNKQIGHRLGISPRTVEVHRAHVLEKMQAANVSQLVRIGLAAGLAGRGDVLNPIRPAVAGRGLRSAPDTRFGDIGLIFIASDRAVGNPPEGGLRMDVSARPGTVYVLDDDPGVRDSLGVLIEAAGYHARVFASGRELLAQSSALSDGCLLLDISLPSESGIDIFHRLRAEGVHIPVIFMTGRAALIDKALAVGDNVQVIEKPMSHLTLLRSLRTALKRDRASSSA